MFWGSDFPPVLELLLNAFTITSLPIVAKKRLYPESVTHGPINFNLPYSSCEPMAETSLSLTIGIILNSTKIRLTTFIC